MKKGFIYMLTGLVAAIGMLTFVPHAFAATTTEGTLVSISGTTPPATIVMQSGITTYSVNVTAATTLVRKYNGTSTLDEFAVGDMLQVRGTVSGTTIDATWIKNLTIQRKGAAQWGKIVSIDTATSSFVFDPQHNKKLDNQTVTTTASTKVFQGNRAGAFSDLTVGMTIKVIGVWRKTQNTVVADRILVKLTELNGKVTAVDCVSTQKTITIDRGGKSHASWTVNLTANTSLRDRKQLQIACTDVKVGHTVQVRGLQTGANTVNALNIWDKTISRTQKTWEGTIATIDTTTKTFTLTQKKKGSDTLTVLTGAETIFVNEDGKVIAFADLVVGHKVQVRGSLTGTTVTANLVLDKNLPAD